MNFITFDDVIINVNEIVDIERPNTTTRDTLIVNLTSGRTIEAKRPSAEDVDALVKKLNDLFQTKDFNITPVSQA